MKRFAEFVVSRPRLVVGIMLLFTAVLATELRHVTTQVRLRDLMPRGHAYMAIDDRLSALFGAEQTSLLAIGVQSGDVFTSDMLRRIQRLTEQVERLPGVIPSSVMSLASPRVKALTASSDGVRVAPLLEAIPEDPVQLRALRERVFSYPMYIGTLVTPDGRGALILADFSNDVSVRATTDALEALAARERAPGIEIYVGGQSPALAALDDATRGIVPLVLLALVVIAVVHYEAFRTGQAVVLPLVTAILAVIWSTGLITILGIRITPWTAVTAILVLSVAAGHAVQILKRYYECFEELHDNRAAVVASLVRIGPVMVTAGVVAAAGFASLATFGVPAVRDFGLMAAIGILSALAIELTVIPAWRVMLPPPRGREAARERQHGLLDPALQRIARVVGQSPRIVLLAVVGGVGVAAVGILELHVNTSFRSWFSRDASVIVADRTIRDRYTGTSTIRILVEGDRPDALLDPQVMAGIAKLQGVLGSEPYVTATLSAAGYMQMMNRAMNDGAEDAYVIPPDRALLSQYLLLFGPDDLARVLSPDARAAAIYALARSDSVDWVEGVFQKLRRVAAEMPAGIHVSVAGGELAQSSAMNATVVREKLLNMLQVSAVIFVLSSLVFRSAVAGLFVLAPLVCAALVNLGLMGWFGSWLSFATATYTSMGVSLGADFAIYLLFRLREEGAGGGPLGKAVSGALQTSGRAIFFVASAIAAGYATLLASNFALWRQLGAYVAIMMATSALATLTLIPALVLIFEPRFIRKVRGVERSERASIAGLG
ncbi:MAG TPA: MMPL family transporter [Myxococcota bacterium]|nr:MMPL family transporter [Myxococcota bacterium]